jgi:membrane protein YqaA with SNARE-associated domain
MKEKFHEFLKRMESFAQRRWYPVFIGMLAFFYHFFPLVPLDTLFVTSTLLIPKRWVSIWMATVVGFTGGAVAFAAVLQHYGLKILEKVMPNIIHDRIWNLSEGWIHQYGAFALGALSLVPGAFHPLLALSALEPMSLLLIALCVFSGRLIKYGAYGFVCVYFPSKLPIPKSAKSDKA